MIREREVDLRTQKQFQNWLIHQPGHCWTFQNWLIHQPGHCWTLSLIYTFPLSHVSALFLWLGPLMMPKWLPREFPGDPTIRTLHVLCWGPGFSPWLGYWDPTSCTAQPKRKRKKEGLGHARCWAGIHECLNSSPLIWSKADSGANLAGFISLPHYSVWVWA